MTVGKDLQEASCDGAAKRACGHGYAGLVGAIIAVPTAAFLTLLYNEYYLNSRWYDREV